MKKTREDRGPYAFFKLATSSMRPDGVFDLSAFRDKVEAGYSGPNKEVFHADDVNAMLQSLGTRMPLLSMSEQSIILLTACLTSSFVMDNLEDLSDEKQEDLLVPLASLFTSGMAIGTMLGTSLGLDRDVSLLTNILPSFLSHLSEVGNVHPVDVTDSAKTIQESLEWENRRKDDKEIVQ